MALAKLFSASLTGLDAEPVEIEVDISSGKVMCMIVGLPDRVVEESKERIRSAIKNSKADFPVKRITINLAPADLKKEGPVFDLGMALGILLASKQIKFDPSRTIILGELALDGRLRGVTGILPVVAMMKEKGFDTLLIPAENRLEADIIPGVNIVCGQNLKDFIEYFSGVKEPDSFISKGIDWQEVARSAHAHDFAFVKGQDHAKRALEIAAAGGHNILLSGPPGSGKTLLARCLPSILPRLELSEALDVTRMYSVAGILPHDQPIVTTRPFRSPHHTTSAVAIVGGGTIPKPGEISLAHRGILFLDEFPEFPRFVLEVLRQPLEDGLINVARASGSVSFPAQFMLVAAQNPCPCGFASDPQKDCVCPPASIARYQKKISGPLLDRIDLHVEVPRVSYDQLADQKVAESSEAIASRVQKARDRQKLRFDGIGKNIVSNSEMKNEEIKKFCQMDEVAAGLLKNAVTQMQLSGRVYHRLLKIARTIADLDEAEIIAPKHIAEALQYRFRQE